MIARFRQFDRDGQAGGLVRWEDCGSDGSESEGLDPGPLHLALLKFLAQLQPGDVYWVSETTGHYTVFYRSGR